MADAESYVKRESGVTEHWRRRQYAPTRARRTGVTVLDDPSSSEGLGRYNAILASIAAAFGWNRAFLPQGLRMLEGTWQTGAIPPSGWPEAAQRREVVSIAMTGFREVCYTLPDARPGRHSIREALP